MHNRQKKLFFREGPYKMVFLNIHIKCVILKGLILLENLIISKFLECDSKTKTHLKESVCIFLKISERVIIRKVWSFPIVKIYSSSQKIQFLKNKFDPGLTEKHWFCCLLLTINQQHKNNIRAVSDEVIQDVTLILNIRSSFGSKFKRPKSDTNHKWNPLFTFSLNFVSQPFFHKNSNPRQKIHTITSGKHSRFTAINVVIHLIVELLGNFVPLKVLVTHILRCRRYFFVNEANKQLLNLDSQFE